MPDAITCFLPYCGEFGWYIMSHVRLVHSYEAPYKLVCCKRSHASLFPNANDVFHEYKMDGPYPIKPAVKPHYTASVIEDIQERITLKYPGSEITFIHYYHSFRDLRRIASAYRNTRFVPQPTIRHGLKTDVVIAPRYIGDCKDFQHWQFLVNGLKAQGLSVGAVGHSSSSQKLVGVDVQAWDYEDIDSDIELLLNASLVISGDSGIGHLALLCQRPTLIIFNPLARFKFLRMMQKQRQPGVFFSIMPEESWSQPHLLIQATVDYFAAFPQAAM